MLGDRPDTLGTKSGNVGASGGGVQFSPQPSQQRCVLGTQRGGFGFAGINLASGCSVVTTRMNTGLLAVGSGLVALGHKQRQRQNLSPQIQGKGGADFH